MTLYGQIIRRAPPHHYYPLVAAVTGRRHGHTLSYRSSITTTTRTAELLSRWSQNFGRLYARRIMELAMASAASYKVKTQLQQQQQQPPSRWMSWNQREEQDWTNELLVTLGDTHWQRYWAAAVRLVNLSLLVAPLVVLAPVSYTGWDKPYWEYCLWGIEQAGPTFIKFVQWATTRQDMFSADFCDKFGKLRDQTRGHAWRETQQILHDRYGPHYQDTVLQLEPKPIGSGCIAQVYRGTLQQDTGLYPKGTQLAVKVQHPRILHKVCVDFYILGKVASFLESLPYLDLKYLSLRDSVDQFCNIMLPQLDLTLEAQHLTRFRQDFGSDPQVHFPAPLPELTHPNVLVETFCAGKPILTFAAKDDDSLAIRKALAHLGLQTTLKMIFLHDFVHGDLQ